MVRCGGDMGGFHWSSRCSAYGLEDRIRARRAKLAEAEQNPAKWRPAFIEEAEESLIRDAAVIIAGMVPNRVGQHASDCYCIDCHTAKERAAGRLPGLRIPARPKLCSSCSRPERPIVATHGEWCVYCATSLGGIIRGADRALHVNPGRTRMEHDSWCNNWTEGSAEENAARARLAAFDRKQAPRQTAESRELAKAHPWSCDECES